MKRKVEKREKESKKKLLTLVLLLLLFLILISVIIIVESKTVIKYEGNGSTEGKMRESVVFFSKDKAISKNNYTKEGYEFKGWSIYNEKTNKWLTEDGWYTEDKIRELNKTKIVLTEDEVKEIIKKEKIKKATLFAEWKEISNNNTEEIETAIIEDAIKEQEKNMQEMQNVKNNNNKEEVTKGETKDVEEKDDENKNDNSKEDKKELTDLEKMQKYFIEKGIIKDLIKYENIEEIINMAENEMEFKDNDEIGVIGKEITLINGDTYEDEEGEEYTILYVMYHDKQYELLGNVEFLTKIEIYDEYNNEYYEEKIYDFKAYKVEERLLDKADIYEVRKVSENKVTILDFTENGKKAYEDAVELIIPATILGNDGKTYNVEDIRNLCKLGDDNNIKKIIISEGITRIGSSAFSHFRQVDEIKIPESVTKIERYGLYPIGRITILRTSLEGIELEEYWTGYDQMFQTTDENGYIVFIRKSLQDKEDIFQIQAMDDNCMDVRITGLTWYGQQLYESAEKLIIPETIIGKYSEEYKVVEIGAYAFQNYTNIVSVEIPNSVIKIGKGAFQYCESLTHIESLESVTEIGAYAFYNCKNLTSVGRLGNVTEIGAYTFYNCKNLISKESFGNVTIIGEGAFQYCESLTHIESLENVTEIGAYAFYNCKNLDSVGNLENVIKIGEGAFGECKNLISVGTLENVRKIDNCAFMGCVSLSEIGMLKNVTYIGFCAFSNCPSLEKITIAKTSLEGIELSKYWYDYSTSQTTDENGYIVFYNPNLYTPNFTSVGISAEVEVTLDKMLEEGMAKTNEISETIEEPLKEFVEEIENEDIEEDEEIIEVQASYIESIELEESQEKIIEDKENKLLEVLLEESED